MKFLDNNRVLNLSTFFCLYLARAIPSTFIMTALQVTMRQEKIGLATIGLLSLARLPWSVKFLWAPLIDRHCVTVGDFKKTIIATETVFALAIIIVGFLDVANNLPIIIALVVISALAASVQNVTNDTMAVNAFGHGDHSAVNSTKTMGRYAGRILGGGFLIMALHKYGWHTLVPLLGFFAILLMIPLILNRHIKITPNPNRKRAKITDFYHFFARKEILPQLGFLLLFFVGFDGILSMMKPWMVDLGYNMKQIGFYSGVIGATFAILMAAFAGWWVKRVGLRLAQRIVGVAALGVPVYFLLISGSTPTLALVLGGILYIRAVEASAAVTLYSTAMDNVRPGREGTDFTIQVVVVHLSGALITMISGGIGQLFNYSGLYIVELVLSVISLAYVFWFSSAKRKAA